MARLYGIRWVFTFPRLTKFKEKKSYQGVFRFDDLNVGLAEAIEILKATPQKFGKSGLLLFEALKIVYNILQCFFLTVLELSSYYHTRIILGHSAISLTAGVIFNVKILTNVGFTFPLLKYFIVSPYFDFGFLDFEYLKRPQIVFLYFLWGQGRNKLSVMNDDFQVRTSKRLFWWMPLLNNSLV